MKFFRKKYKLLLILFACLVLTPCLFAAYSIKEKKLPIPLLKRLVLGNDSVFYSEGKWTDVETKLISSDSGIIPVPYYLNSLYLEFNNSQNTDSLILFQYYLDGYDNGWRLFTKNHTKEYTNLNKGKYVFHARYIDATGRTGEQFTLNFRIFPPVYRSKLAYIIYFIFLILIYWTIIKSRIFRFAKERYRLEKIINERTEEMVREMDKSENLLTNVLPKGTADELKLKGKVAKKKYKMATVLFSDIQGFTKIAEEMNPEKLIDELDTFFFHFDTVVEKHNIEKIKTIGDAYMCAGGIPDKNSTNPIEVVLAALEMQEYMKRLKKEVESQNRNFWDIRIGIHTGPVIAGVVGQKKLSYDIWGDTVNTASRMESSGEAGRINISGSTYEFVRDYFICEYRGKMPVKYKGEIDMYFVKGIRPELSENLKELPNKSFRIQLQLKKIPDIEEVLLDKMAKKLPDNLLFHNLKHTINILTQTELLGRAEKINDEEMVILQTASLFHDSGFMEGYKNPKQASCFYGREILPKYGYSESQIESICKLINSTLDTKQNKSKLEKILSDANLAYLGRADFIDIIKNQADEMVANNLVSSEREWFNKQLSFVNEHEFFTKTARLLREVSKEEQAYKLKELI